MRDAPASAAGHGEAASDKKSNRRAPSKRSLRALDGLNFLLADVQTGVGPFLAVYLASHHWSPERIGIAIGVGGAATVIAQAPAGALIDHLHQKRILVVGATLAIAAGGLLIAARTTFVSVLIAQVMIGIAAAIALPAVAAITLGMVGHKGLARRMGRNQSFNSAGNLVAAAIAGASARLISGDWIFYFVAFFSIIASIAALAIKAQDIDYETARGATGGKDGKSGPEGLRSLLSNRTLLLFSGTVILFHFANAAMLPLVGQKLTAAAPKSAALYISACIITAQFVIIPVAILAGRAADTYGRKMTLLVAYMVLPVRGFLFTLTDTPYLLVSVQLLDGLAAGIFGILVVIIVADLTEGSGRFNLAQGALAMATGIGASLSQVMTGFVVGAAGYDAGFLVLMGVALIALAVFWMAMPETRPSTRTGGKKQGNGNAASDLIPAPT